MSSHSLWFARQRRNSRLSLERLELRDVPAAVIDLASAGAQGTADGALFEQTGTQPTGTGVIQSFVRVQATGVEQGYNTDARPLQFDENQSPEFTRSLSIGQLPGATINGVSYREFLLDINQKSSSPLLSLDELRLYVGQAPNLTGYDPTTQTLAGLTPIYDMDGAGDVTVKLDARLSHGSGSGDMFFLVPDADFVGQPANGFVYLYSKFGQTWGANGGFEEWAVPSGGSFVPPSGGPSTLSGKVTLNDSTSSPLRGITIDLLNASGKIVATTSTCQDGTYSFTGILPGMYSVYEDLSGSNLYFAVESAAGTVKNVTDGSTTDFTHIVQVTLNAGDVGVNYNFVDGTSGPAS
jgi:SdrD B-like domain